MPLVLQVLGKTNLANSQISQSNGTASNNLHLANEYNLSTVGAYKYYELYITGNYGNAHCAIAEWGLYGGGFVLPSQVGNAGKFLKTDGTLLEWTDLSINNLSDVDTSTNAPTDVQALVYNSSNNVWEPGTIVTSVSLEDITDVSISSPGDGQALIYDTSLGLWKPGTVATSGGTDVSAHTEIQTGNEDYLSALTVGQTKYKIGTSVQNPLSYSDTSELVHSFPFRAAQNATDALSNHGSSSIALINRNNAIWTSSDGFEFSKKSGSGDIADRLDLDLSANDELDFATNTYTFFVRYKPTVTNQDNTMRVLVGATSVGASSSQFQCAQNGHQSNDLVVNFPTYTSTSLVVSGAYVANKQINLFVIVNSTSYTVYADNEVSGKLNVFTNTISTPLNATYKEFQIGHAFQRITSDDRGIIGYVSDFMIFNGAVTHSFAQQWISYIDNNYTNSSNPAPLKFLADVSDTTPQTGDSLVYSGISNKWQPQRAASQFGLPAGDNAKFWVVAGESTSRVGNYPIHHVGTGRTFNYDGDGHLYLNHATGQNYLKITDSNTMINFQTASFTYAVVVDLSLNDGPSGSSNINYGQTYMVRPINNSNTLGGSFFTTGIILQIQES